MLTLLVSLALAALPPPPAAASVTCADAPATCEPALFAGVVPTTTLAGTADDAAVDPPEYATPAEVDCPTPAGEAQMAGTTPDHDGKATGLAAGSISGLAFLTRMGLRKFLIRMGLRPA